MNPSTAFGGILASGGPYDTVTGLPVHSLIIHVTVVLLPLSALALIALVLVPKWRRSFIWVTLAGLVIGSGAAFVSKESGQALAARVGNPGEHAQWGDILPFVAVGLVVVAALWFWVERRAAKSGEGPALTRGSGLVALTGIASVVLALVSIGMTVVVGHTGAQAVWADQIAASDAVATGSQVPAPVPTTAAGATGTAPAAGATGTAPAAGATVYSMSDVAAHNKVSDCWSVVNGKVYNLTTWISQHPGGPEVITQMCGVDASQGFNGQHSGQGKPNKELATFEIGTVG